MVQFVSLLPFGLLILIPGVILLYVLKQKSEDKEISSLYLWRETYKNMEVSSPWEKFKNNILMYIQIAVILSLILALAGPYLASTRMRAKNMVLVLDNSGSMNAIYGEEKSRLEAAKQQAIEYVEKWNDNIAVTVISCNQNAKVLLSGATDTGKIKESILNIEPTDIAGDLEPSVSMVNSMSEQWDGYEALFFSDSSLDMGKVKGSFVDVSSDGVNGAIDYVNHTKEKDGSISVVAKVSNYGKKEISSDINLYLNDKLLRIENSDVLQPKESTMVFFDAIKPSEYKAGETLVLKAEWNQRDALKEDNTAYTVVREKEEQKVLLISKQNVFLEKVIGTLEQVNLYKANTLEEAKDSGKYDLYIFDGVMPKELPEGNLMFLDPTASEVTKDLFQVTDTEKNGGVVKVEEQAFTQMVSKDFSFGVNQYKKIQPTTKAKVFLKAEKDKVGFMEYISGRNVAVLAFNLHSSDFALQTEFPIIMNQLFGNLLNGYLLEKAQVTAGEEYFVDQVSYRKDKAGVYTIEGKTQKGKVKEKLVVNFPTYQESALGVPVKVTQGKAKKGTVVEGIKNTRDIKTPIILIVMLLFGIEWVVYLKNR